MTPQQRYRKAAHAMQSGVSADMISDPNRESAGSTTPKQLRMGLNSALVDSGALAELLIAKGIITGDEYVEAIAAGMEREQKRYEVLLSERFQKKITLGLQPRIWSGPPGENSGGPLIV